MFIRFRSLVEDGGIENPDDPDEEEFITIQGARYWQLQTARLVFIVIFEVRWLFSFMLRTIG